MEVTVKVPGGTGRIAVLGPAERNIKLIREALGVSVTARQAQVVLKGDRGPVTAARQVLESLIEAAETGQDLTRAAVLDLISQTILSRERGQADESEPVAELAAWDGRLNVYAAGRPVRPKTPNQHKYLEAIRDHDLVFAIGPAGTGKTYLAVASAVHLMKEGRVKKVILTRPAVEAGEKLGFLPGGLEDKVNPYLRPLCDALHDMMDFSTIRRFMENDIVEVVPLAFMRGRTLNNAVIILDEAQNATRSQMKMFLTRLGHGGKMIVTGDVTQTDLPNAADTGLVDASIKLAKTPGVAFVHLDRTDVVRHNLVQRIIDAYGEEDAKPTRRTSK